MKEYTVLFIHGYGGHSGAIWFPLLKRALRGSGINILIPSLPERKNPQAKDWLNQIDRMIKNVNGPLMLVGHSLGTRAVLLYLEQFQRKVEDVLLIGTMSNDVQNSIRLDGKHATFWNSKIDYNVVKQFSDKFTLMHSLEDKIWPYNVALETAEDLDGELLTYAGMEHFDYDFCFQPIVEVIQRRAYEASHNISDSLLGQLDPSSALVPVILQDQLYAESY